MLTGRAGRSPCGGRPLCRGFFIFIFFKNIFYRNIFSVSYFTVLYPYRPVGGGRDLHINKHKFFCAEAPGGSLPPGGGAAGSPPAWQGGGRLPPNKKAEPLSSHPHFLPTRSREGRGREEGEGGNSTGEALPDFGSEPQVTNISQLSH